MTAPFTTFPIPTVLSSDLGNFISIKDFGAVGDGVTNDAPAFNAFNAAYAGKSVSLIIPPGNYINTGSAWLDNIPELVVWAYGATVTACAMQGGFTQVNTDTALINSTTPGDTTVTLVNPGDSVHFAAGNWINIGSIEMQLDRGFPPNLYNNEYARILSISSPTITLDPGFPAYMGGHIKYRHLSTYPDNGPASAWAGGAARIFKMTPKWDAHIKIYGLTINQTGQIYLLCRKLELIDVQGQNPQDPSGIAPSQSKDVLYDGCNFPYIELDKCIETFTMRNSKCTTLHTQSASVNNMIVDGCCINSIGPTTTRNVAIRGSRIGSMDISSEFGRAESITLENNYIASVQSNLPNNFLDLTVVTFSNGTFILPIATGGFPGVQQMAQYGIPGAVGFFASSGGGDANWGNPFVVLNVRADATNYYIDTTLPALPVYSGSGLPVAGANRVIMHPAVNFNCVSCVGCADIVSYSEGPKNRPYRSYGRSTLMSSAAGAGVTVWGYLVKITVNVLRPYTGAVGSGGAYHAGFNYSLYTNNVHSSVQDIINLKIAGTRTYTPGAVSGAQSGDTLTPIPANAWIGGGPFFYFGLDGDYSGDPSNLWPVATIIAETDQGLTVYGSLQTPQQLVW